MAITREELVAWGTRNGWALDSWGHLKKEFGDELHRLKLSNIAVRHEVKSQWGWIHLSSSYYKKLTITDNDKLTVKK